MKSLRFLVLCCGVASISLAGCSGGHAAYLPHQQAFLPTPKSVSPALIKPAPMVRTAVLPASAMHNPLRPMAAVLPASWVQVPGAASQVAAAPDGSLWALSTQPAGADKYIWHDVGGTWTNITGLAAHIAVAPNGTLYAINSGGGTYAYSGGTWTALGGGADAITAAADSSIYVLSNAGTGDQAIWHNAGGTWSQVPGGGVAIAASWDVGKYSVPGVGNVMQNGLYILNAEGSIYYENSDGSFAHFPGAASAIAPTTNGGVYVLGYPANPAGNTIYYFDLSSTAWAAQPGAGVNIASNSTTLYVVGAGGGIYYTTITNLFPNIPVNATLGSIGPRGLYGSGKMQAIAVNPANPNTMYVAGGYGTYDGVPNDTGIYGTTDGGATWSALDNGLSDTNVNALWLDPKNPAIVLAATQYGGIARSTNSGVSWSSVSSAASATQFVASGSSLYASTASGVLVSTADGVTWTTSATSGTSSALALAAASNGTIYAGFNDGTIEALQNGSWKTTGMLTQTDPTHLTVDATNPSELYATAGSKLYRSTDGGSSWAALGLADPANQGISIVVADPTTSGTVYAAAGDTTVSVSTDSGNTWTSTGIWGDQRGLVILPGSPERFIDASDQGIEVCQGTMSCAMISTALSTNIVNGITAMGSNVAVTMQDYPPATSHDAGSTWAPDYQPFQEDGTVLLDRDGSGYCYGFDFMGFAISKDSCSTFTSVASVPKPTVGPIINGSLISVDQTNPSNVYVAALTAVYASHDHGQTFAQTNWPYNDPWYGYTSGIAVSPQNGSHIVLMSATDGVQVTFDGGNTWKAATWSGATVPSYYPSAVAISPANDDVAVIDSGGLLYRSTDGGLTFTLLPNLPNATLGIARAVRSPFLVKLFRHNPLAALIESQTTKPAPFPVSLAFDQTGAPPYLAAATTNGVYVSSDYGNDWQLVSSGTIPYIFSTVQWDNGTLYAGSWGNGLLKSSAPLQQ